MRTTINLDDDLLALLKREAIARQQTITRVIHDSLKDALQRPRRTVQPTSIPALPTFGTGGVQPGIDLDDSANLLAHLDADHAPL